jgi:hypothetical protein
MNIAAVGQEIKVRLDTIKGLRAHLGPPDSVTPPAAVVVLPEEVRYDAAYGRGTDAITWPILLLVGRVNDRGTLERISQFADGSGPMSVKAVLEDHTYTSCDFVHVVRAQFDVVNWQGTDFQGVLFELSIAGSGT